MAFAVGDSYTPPSDKTELGSKIPSSKQGFCFRIISVPAVPNNRYMHTLSEPRWDDVFKDDPQSSKRFKVHPDRELAATFEQFQKLRTLVSVQLFTAIDAVTPIK
jgi:hypothetical protein